MNGCSIRLVGMAGILWLSAVWSAVAGPSLPITKPPVQPLTLQTGPLIDPVAAQGQWVIDTGGVETVRTNEFYDEPLGGFESDQAIHGVVTNILYAPGTPPQPILGFDIEATIINDTSSDATWPDGSNSHGETLNYREPPYVGPMMKTVLTAEFAIRDMATLPLPFTPPYRDRQPYIEALNEDLGAWYCWSPESEDPDHQPPGGYFVPAWDFGTILPGMSAQRSLSFAVASPGLLPTDPRYIAIQNSFDMRLDIFLNRGTSLKISTWIDDLALDTGGMQEEPPLRMSDVSVFHNMDEEALLDFGDAPDPSYPTLLANDGARHVMMPGVHMGLLVDAEPDGQPDATATGDDLAGLPDEDGVTFKTPLVAGFPATIDVVCSVPGFLSVWIDFNANGSWSEAGEKVFSTTGVAAGTNTLAFTVPPGATPGVTFSRFRFTTTQTALLPTGQANDGEVEDYAVDILQEAEPTEDFGDAPDGPYPTLRVNNGARHTIVPGVHLGQYIDGEPDGQPTPNSDGDDINPPLGLDDEDGVFIPTPLVAGSTVPIHVVASTNGYLNAWIDWNNNGTWADPGEHVYIQQLLHSGVNVLNLNVPMPPALVPGGPHSRWRFTTYAPATPSFMGAETDGEVEDYEVHLEVLDFGDAPDPFYPTLLINDGARHRIPSRYWLGVVPPDADGDGQPHPQALGDDLTGTPDEDGASLVGDLVRGSNAVFLVVASTNGYLNAWLDFNRDGDWFDAGEQIATNRSLAAGTNQLAIAVPAGASLGYTFARFRFGSQSGLGVTGLASDGEVEDHMFTILQPPPPADIIITNLYCGTNLGVAFVEWGGASAVTYETQFTTNQLTATNLNWTSWGGVISAPPYRQQDTNAFNTSRFYRVVAPWVPAP